MANGILRAAESFLPGPMLQNDKLAAFCLDPANTERIIFLSPGAQIQHIVYRFTPCIWMRTGIVCVLVLLFVAQSESLACNFLRVLKLLNPIYCERPNWHRVRPYLSGR